MVKIATFAKPETVSGNATHKPFLKIDMKNILFLFTIILTVSCTQNPSSTLTEKVDTDFMLGKWKGVTDTCEVWINKEKMFLGLPDRIVLIGGQQMNMTAIGVVSPYVIDKGKLYGTINGIINPITESPLPIKYSNDTIGLELNKKLCRLYRVEKEIPNIQDTKEWQENALKEITSRFIPKN